tara:strand:+ start:628 stop:819 length:192 start_codon:yes stop_codon:yes gene_type:complete
VAVNNVVTRFTSDFQYIRGLHQVYCFSLHLFFFVSFQREGEMYEKKEEIIQKKNTKKQNPLYF